MAKIVITTGGTGGHVFPALAVAEELKSGNELLFIGSAHGPEARWAKEAGLDIVCLPVRGILGRGLRTIASLGMMLVAVARSVVILKRFSPDVVAGFGAYASFAPLAAAKLLGIPVLVHEQNAFPGLTNRILGRLAMCICLSLESDATRKAFEKKKCVITGNPVRQDIVKADKTADNDPSRKRLLVMGGSQGAQAINSLILSGLKRLREAGAEIWHQTGASDFERVQAGYQAYHFDKNKITPFIDDMGKAYGWADMVLCRSGASTVAELAIAGKPAVFIPFPYATHDHQTFNAATLAERGAARLIAEKELADCDVIGELCALLEDRSRLSAMSAAAEKMGRPAAAADVATQILRLCDKSLLSD
jgi:UDP-N-acetylglucosamine--N-acetylmuramyl-(pentapeptide) pyrophosphoryl-undecaprenol N-acetylglucosamine transferase